MQRVELNGSFYFCATTISIIISNCSGKQRVQLHKDSPKKLWQIIKIRSAGKQEWKQWLVALKKQKRHAILEFSKKKIGAIKVLRVNIFIKTVMAIKNSFCQKSKLGLDTNTKSMWKMQLKTVQEHVMCI